MKDEKKKSHKSAEKPKDLKSLSDEELKQVRGGSLNTYVSKVVGEKQGTVKGS